MNMALDEVLWQSATTPLLRFYEWDHPALSFGYFGRYADVAHYASERELVRRCTGGGIVFHGNDLTYALIIPSNSKDQDCSPMAIYARVHEAIQRALQELGTEAKLIEQNCRRFAVRNAAPTSENTGACVAQPPSPSYGAPSRATSTGAMSTNACFANPVAFDVMVNGQKVAGAAQRRSRRGLLQQGSIQNVECSGRFRECFIECLCENAVDGVIDSARVEQAQQLADTKYCNKAWLDRR